MAIKKTTNEEYSFVCGFMAAREKYFLTREKLEKMINGKNADEALRVLLELNYGNEDEEVAAIEFESLLSRELENTYSFILPFVPEPAYFDIFRYPSDYHNVKTLLKAEFLGIDAHTYLMGTGSIPTDELIDMVHGREYDSMREEMSKGILDALEEYNLSLDPQAIDLILDKACYMDMSILVLKLNCEYLNGYLALRIGLINLITFVRIRMMNKPIEFFSKVYIENGIVPKAIFEEGFNDSFHEFSESIDAYGLQNLLIESEFNESDTVNIAVLEKLCDNFLMSYISEAKYITYGKEPLIAYIAAKEIEIKTVRIIMAGKLSGLSPELIRDRIRDTYA